MILPEPMSRVTILGPKTLLRPVVDELHGLKLLHIKDHAKSSDMDIGEPLPEYDEVAQLLVRVRTISSNLELKEEKAKAFDGEIAAVRSRVDSLYSEVSEAVARRAYLQKVLDIFSHNRQRAALKSMTLEYDDGDYEKHHVFVGFVQREHGIGELGRLFKGEFEGVHAIALSVPPEKVAAAKSALDADDFFPVDSDTVPRALPGLRGKLAEPKRLDLIEKSLKEALKKVSGVLDTAAKEHATFLAAANSRLVTENRKAEAPLRFGATEKTFLVAGWVPSAEVARLQGRLGHVAGEKLLIEHERVSPHENAPVKQNLPRIARPFKHFLDMFAGPLYGEVNPTVFIALTFPLFFGFMLGDVGYGLVVLALAVLILKATKGKPLIGLLPPAALIFAALCTIFFGAVFGEFFGAEIGLYHPLFPRVELEFLGHGAHDGLLIVADGKNVVMGGVNSDALLAISVLVGVVHILIGMFTGFYNSWRMHGLKQAVMHKAGWILLMPGMLWLMVKMSLLKGGYAALANSVLPPDLVIYIMLGIGVLLIVIGEGITGVVELPALLSNLFSYARLMAVGLASVLLALVANQMAAQAFGSGNIVGYIFGAVVLLLFHLINLLLGILSPFLHSLRLHYVEYFTKFYSGGGKQYAPFGAED